MTLTLKNCTAKIRLSLTSKDIANSICSALAPDLLHLPNKDVSKISIEDKDIIFTTKTDDIASLRATINSYLLLSDASYRCAIL